MKEKIKLLMSEILKVDIKVLEDDLAIGDIPEWDSLHHMMIMTALGKEFNISFTKEDLVELEDVKDIVALVCEKTI